MEYEETDVWYVCNERTDFDPKVVKLNGSSSTLTSRIFSQSTTARMIPRPKSNNSDMESFVPKRQSAPVNIPDWSKIYGKSNRSSQNSTFLDYGDHDGKQSWDSDDDDDDDDGDGNYMIPPHEWIAQKLARSQISSFSVCEGAGRTLKGRDLSRVRNAILTKTGFLE
ncbi:protein S40-6-like [Rutidosis leptorrhynchoides]|uniref:protein S40-6-like n=1 Tax=Rutidosis leptorrhynchoides TaxID=125765 RepID=UPI003A99D263